MKRDFSALGKEPFDLLIIGGGITGAALAWDAVQRGITVALVDKADFGAATSSATSKLIHGGLRYLKNAEFGLVRESLRERRILQTIAGHVVRPVPFMIPTYKRGNRKWLIKAGMVMYDMFSYDRGRLEDPEQRLPRHRMFSPEEVRRLEPGIPVEGLTGGAVYYDCRCDPDRLTLEFLLGAAGEGAVLVNHAKAGAIACTGQRVDGVDIQDVLTGEQAHVRAKVIANVAGPWADHIDVLCGAGEEVTLKRSKGIHLITRPLVKRHAVVLRTSAGHHFFIIPWRGHSLIGTTDTEYTGDPDALSVTDEDVQGFLDDINEAYPRAELKADDVLYRYGGMRPLVDQETQVYKASRKYEIVDHAGKGFSGYITAMGGKYTTSRNLARKIVDRVIKRLGRPKAPCKTGATLLPGGVSGPFSTYLTSSLDQAGDLLPPDITEHLVWTYGRRHDQVLGLVRNDASLGERITDEGPEILAQVVFAVEDEMARTLCDVMVRRTGIGTLGHPGDPAVDKVLHAIAGLLGWDDVRKAHERETYLAKVAGQPEVPPG